MSDENLQEPTATETADVDALKRSIEALERKNHELIGKLKDVKSKVPAVPDGVDVNELIEFKRRKEQEELETQGKYTEARQALEQQFRDITTEKDRKIQELEARIKELELVSPAISALAEVVHDPELILKTKLSADRIEREQDGTVVVVDGYQRVPVSEWARTLPNWMQKQPKPQGSGAPTGGRGSTEVPAGMKNPFAPEHFNLTEQSRLFRTDRDLYERMKAAAKSV
ncbi:hypothetical protein EBT31_17645 [bacterium]|nr:hypothetical protein [bacterium]